MTNLDNPVEFNYERARDAILKASESVKGQLEQKILGKKIILRGCCSLNPIEAQATGIKYSDQDHQRLKLISWVVVLRKPNGREDYASLTSFLPNTEIESIFNQAFEGIDAKRFNLEYIKKMFGAI
jgi:hypothetical protein